MTRARACRWSRPAAAMLLAAFVAAACSSDNDGTEARSSARASEAVGDESSSAAADAALGVGGGEAEQTGGVETSVPVADNNGTATGGSTAPRADPAGASGTSTAGGPATGEPIEVGIGFNNTDS